MTKKNIYFLKTYRPKISKDLIPSSAKDLDLIEKKQNQIVEAACNLFFKKGFHRTNIREIADESSMSMGQLYHYISSKDDILFLVAKHMQELWYDYLVEFGFE
jgi:AcrR family transcriptional regulator